MTMTKVFCVGMHKAGTTSIHMLSQQMGLDASHATAWSHPPLDIDLLSRHEIFSDGGGHYWNEALEFGSNFDLRALRDAFPGCKFILQYRDLRPWMASKMSHAGWKRTTEIEPDTGETPVHADWNKDRRIEALRGWIENRQRYHAVAAEFLKTIPEDVLVIDVTKTPDAPMKIGEFIYGPGRVRAVENFGLIHKILNRLPGKRIVPRQMPRANEAKADRADKGHCRAIADRITTEADPEVEPVLLELQALTDRARTGR
jgi:hypothetical protein